MKKFFIILLFFCSLLNMSINAQNFNELINLKRYKEANDTLKTTITNEKRIIFIGNSITQAWANTRPQFFEKNNFVGRGIGGQTSPQLLSRFRRDVVELKPYAVIINVGTNDIAENTGEYDQNFTLGNIQSMADVARANNIQVILSSVLPAGGFKWRPTITDSVEKIEALNKKIKDYAQEMNFLYIDYHSLLKDKNGALQKNLSEDGVHPNEECYQFMEQILLMTLYNQRKMLVY